MRAPERRAPLAEHRAPRPSPPRQILAENTEYLLIPSRAPSPGGVSLRTFLALLGIMWGIGVPAGIAGADTAQLVTVRARCTVSPCPGPAIVFVHGRWE